MNRAALVWVICRDLVVIGVPVIGEQSGDMTLREGPPTGAMPGNGTAR